MGMVQLYYTVSNRLFLVGLGERGAAEVRAVLDEEKARSEGKARSEMPDEVGSRLEQVAPGWQSVGVLTVSSIVEQVLAGLRQDGMLSRGALDQVEAGVTMAVGLLDRYRLQTVVTVTKASESALTLQLIW
jgi:hypothetical protein